MIAPELSIRRRLAMLLTLAATAVSLNYSSAINVDWKLSWGVPETGWGQELRIVPRREIPLLLLAGPDSYKIFGFDRYNRSREVKLKISGPYWRYDPTLEGDPV